VRAAEYAVVAHGRHASDNDQNSMLWFGVPSSVAGASRTGTLVRTFYLIFDGKISSASQRSDFCVQYKDERNWAVLLETQEPAGKQGATTPGMQPIAKERERNLEGRGCKQ
jgi:hypothetical protein